MLERIAYQGTVFTIEWYFNEKGESQVLEYFLSQPKEMQRKLLNLLRLMGDHGKIFDETKFRNEGDGVYAFKPKPDRYLCFFWKGKKLILAHAFAKKSQKLPTNEKDQALKAMKSYEERIRKGKYYEEES